MRFSVFTICTIAITCSLTAAASADDSLRYSLIPLPTLDDGPIIGANAINSSGVITGTSGSSQVDPGQHAVIWTAGGIENLDSLFDISDGAVINDAGTVAGIGSFCPPVNGACSSFFARALPGGQFELIGTLNGGPGEVRDINAAGDFTGWGYLDGSFSRAILFSEKNGLMDLGTLGGFSSQATALNDARQVVGFSYLENAQGTHAFLWQDGAMTDLGTFGGANSRATDINQSGTVVGWADLPDGTCHAFRTDANGQLEDIQTLPAAVSSRATVVHDNGTIAGVWNDGSNDFLFVFTPQEGMIDIGRPAKDFAVFQGPIAINGQNVVIGTGFTSFYEVFSWIWSPEFGMQLLIDTIVNDELELFELQATGMNENGQIVTTKALLEPVALVLGDVNLDGEVNLLDVAPFVERIGSGTFQAEADVNGDGAVDLLDVQPFVSLLSG